jgi:hypothetical protein
LPSAETRRDAHENDEPVAGGVGVAHVARTSEYEILAEVAHELAERSAFPGQIFPPLQPVRVTV